MRSKFPLLDPLPDDCTFEDALDRVYALLEIEQGERDAGAGRGLSDHRLLRELFERLARRESPRSPMDVE